MLKRILYFAICCFPLLQFSQDYSKLWEGHFSFNNIKDISQGNNKIFAASDNAVFNIDVLTNEITETTTINGLSGESISAIFYSEVFELLVIGYENGLIEIVFDNESKILTVVDILEKPTIPFTNKGINHINGYENIIYISTDYGISVFDLERLEFGDTYFIGNAGTQIPITQTTIFNGYIYASSTDNNGIKKGDITSSNLIDPNNWQSINTGSWVGIEAQNDKLYAINSNRKIYSLINDVPNEIFTYPTTPNDIRSVDTNLIVTTTKNVFVYDSNFNVISQASINPDFNTNYNCATVNQDHIYIGSENFGILKTPLNNPITFEEIHPEGPLLNVPFSIKAEPTGVWVTFGEYSLLYNPYPLNSRGFSHLIEGKWINTPFSDALGARCLNSISVNPLKTNQVFVSSFIDGLLEINEELPTILYDETNSGLESLILPSDPNYIDIRLGASTFDKDGLLWSITSRIDKPLKSYNPNNNQWKSYSFTDIIPDGFSDNLGFSDLITGNDGTKWVASYRKGVIGFNETQGGTSIKNISKEEENMPTEFATALALDNRNQLWIGTFRGLRVLYNTSNFFTDDSVRVEEIIIEEDGIAKELLFQQGVTDIKVDGANNKWIGTSDSGLFYFSPDGQNTIFHFTKENSPLPSSSIRDLSIDGNNGIVYIATDKGLVSFRSGSSSPIENLEKAYVYPNPVRPGFNMVDKKITIKDISENVNIKITDIEGNLVAEAQSKINQRYGGYNLEIDGGTAYWNGKNLANTIVASGVYLVMLSDLDTFETKVIKLMVVR
jgi:ligand-binding sensor domain-containing protein